MDEDYSLEDVAITSDGDYAWIVSGNTTEPPTPGPPGLDGLYAPDGQGGDHLLDHGPPDSLSNLHARGRGFTWVNAGRSKTMELP